MQILKKITSLAVAAALSVSAFCTIGISSNAADTKPAQITLHYDISGDGVAVEKDQYGNQLYIYDLSGEPGKSVRVSYNSLVRAGYTFSGWTIDGVLGYAPGDVIQIPDEDTTLKPVWSKNSDNKKYAAKFSVIVDGKDLDPDKFASDIKAKEGEMVKVPHTSFDYPGYACKQIGWVYDGTVYRGEQNIIMPSHDIELTPNWLRMYTLKYSGGDVDRLPGITEQSLERAEKLETNLAESSRILRIGFYNSGWLCSADGIIYPPEVPYLMPSEDVTFTAVWKPVTYTVVFRPDLKNKDNYIKIDGETDTTIICPDINTTKKGYKFGGWDYKGTIYQPGDEFFIYGEISGLGIPLEAVWIPETEVTLYGDANCDGLVSIADAVLIMQVLTNNDTYGVGGSSENAISKQGALNADCCSPGDGITSKDAFVVQMRIANIIKELPYYPGTENDPVTTTSSTTTSAYETTTVVVTEPETSSTAAETTTVPVPEKINIHFDISDPDISIVPDDDLIPEINDIVCSPNESVKIPDVKLKKEGLVFSGWTADGVRGYVPNSVIQAGNNDVTLTPVFYDAFAEQYAVEYKPELNGELFELPLSLKKSSAVPGTFIQIPLTVFNDPKSEYTQFGWKYEGNEYSGQQYIVMPDHEITLTPNWKKMYCYTVTAGDVDRLNGAEKNEFSRAEGTSFETPEAGRFSRNGFTITGWLCDYDNVVYGPLKNFVMPSQDTTLTAVWEPIEYVVLFRAGTTSADNIKISAKTDTTIICPELNVTKKGYHFGGWEYEGEIYQPGDEFLIRGAMPGLGISPKAVWIAD